MSDPLHPGAAPHQDVRVEAAVADGVALIVHGLKGLVAPHLGGPVVNTIVLEAEALARNAIMHMLGTLGVTPRVDLKLDPKAKVTFEIER